MQILLSRTWEELHELVSQPSSALHVLQVMNRISHRSWKFVTTFDGDNRNNLHISTDPPLKLEDFENIANGVVVEIFRCKTMVFHSPAGQLLKANIDEYLREVPLTNVLEFTSGITQEQSGIYLYGFCGTALPPEMGNKSKIQQALRSYTWFATKTFARYNHKLMWKCLGEETEFAARNGEEQTPSSAHKPSFESEHLLYSGTSNGGTVKFVTHSGLTKNSLVHGRFGEIDPTQHTTFWQELTHLTGCSWNIEFDEPLLRMRYHQELTPSILVATILTEIQMIIGRITSTDDFQRYLQAVQLEVSNIAATQLQALQNKARIRATVRWNGQDLMCEPKAEAEVICLLSKLEVLPNALPLYKFKLREYTPKTGIDALADYQILSNSKFEILSPVELEYSFVNFLNHQHPPEQVGMVICWLMSSQQDKNITQVTPGLYLYRENTNQLWVVVLSEISGIEVN